MCPSTNACVAAPKSAVLATFQDVPGDYWAWRFIEALDLRGITTGCATNPLRYCPESQVINAEMAPFLLRSKEGPGYVAPACTGAGPFLDVACAYWAAPQIGEVARRGIMTGCGGGNFCPGDPVTRAQMAGYLARTFDIPVATDPNTARSVQLAYTQGLLTGVTSGATTYGTIAYYPNLLVSQIAHGNGVMETQGNDPNEMRRPSSLAATGPWASWSSGGYSYDGAGNVKAIGTSWFTYDAVSRLVSSTLFDGPTGGGNQKQQSYAFDAFGNLQSIGGTSGRATPTSSQTNRLSGAAGYDAAGNLTSWNGASYTYDRFNQMTQMASGSESWVYLYTADDERIWSYDLARNLSHWTVRDLGGKVLRDYLNNAGRWSVGTDYLYRRTLPVTRGSGDRAAYHVYYPFGEEATAFNQDAERMKFTGHERDLASPAGAGDDLDYMHARHESPVTGRFLSVDPVGGDLFSPQSWNRYSYAMNCPFNYTDPEGKFSLPTTFLVNAMNAMLAFQFSETITVKFCEDKICQVATEVDHKAYSTMKLIERGVMFELGALLTMGFGEATPVADFGISRAGSNAAGAAVNPNIYTQLEKQLAKDGPSSIHKALRSAEKALKEHEEKLSGLQYKSKVESTIRNIEKQIATIKQFMKDHNL